MSEEKVLFEMRATTDGAVETTESPEWQAHHSLRRKRKRFAWAGCCPPFKVYGKGFGFATHPPAEDELRHALDSLQSIYDDLYGPPPESKV